MEIKEKKTGVMGAEELGELIKAWIKYIFMDPFLVFYTPVLTKTTITIADKDYIEKYFPYSLTSPAFTLWVPTRNDDRYVIVFTPLIFNYSGDEVFFILLHELGHVILAHNARIQRLIDQVLGKDAPVEEKLAEQYFINLYVADPMVNDLAIKVLENSHRVRQVKILTDHFIRSRIRELSYYHEILIPLKKLLFKDENVEEKPLTKYSIEQIYLFLKKMREKSIAHGLGRIKENISSFSSNMRTQMQDKSARQTTNRQTGKHVGQQTKITGKQVQKQKKATCSRGQQQATSPHASVGGQQQDMSEGIGGIVKELEEIRSNIEKIAENASDTIRDEIKKTAKKVNNIAKDIKSGNFKDAQKKIEDLIKEVKNLAQIAQSEGDYETSWRLNAPDIKAKVDVIPGAVSDKALQDLSKQKHVYGKDIQKLYDEWKEFMKSLEEKGKDWREIRDELVRRAQENAIRSVSQGIFNMKNSLASIKNAGFLPGFFAEFLSSLYTASIRWNKYIKQVVEKTLYGEKFFTDPLKPSRRFMDYSRKTGLIMPGKSSSRKRLIVLADVSGSITNEELKQFMGEIEAMARDSNRVAVIFWDGAIQRAFWLKGKRDVHKLAEIKGRGGTTLAPILEKLLTGIKMDKGERPVMLRLQPQDTLIILSDWILFDPQDVIRVASKIKRRYPIVKIISATTQNKPVIGDVKLPVIVTRKEKKKLTPRHEHTLVTIGG